MSVYPNEPMCGRNFEYFGEEPYSTARDLHPDKIKSTVWGLATRPSRSAAPQFLMLYDAGTHAHRRAGIVIAAVVPVCEGLQPNRSETELHAHRQLRGGRRKESGSSSGEPPADRRLAPPDL